MKTNTASPFEGSNLPMPLNYEPKAICMLVLDVSGSMAGSPIGQLNEGVRKFIEFTGKDSVASQRVELGIVSFSGVAELIQEPTLVSNISFSDLEIGTVTNLVPGMELAMKTIENRKAYYRQHGITHFRPFIILMTDGAPTDKAQDIRTLGERIKIDVDSKKYMFYPLGVTGANERRMMEFSHPSTPPMPLDPSKFEAFFRWLSNSMSSVSRSTADSPAQFEGPGSWASSGWAGVDYAQTVI